MNRYILHVTAATIALAIAPPALAAGKRSLSCDITPSAATVSVGQTVSWSASPAGGFVPYAFRWNFQGGTPATADMASATVAYATAGQYVTSLKVTDSRRRSCTSTAAITVIGAPPPPPPPPTGNYPSINSTSVNSAAPPASAVPMRSFISRPEFQLLGANDLGMHCGDLDHRVVSILPLFNVLHAQVVHRGSRDRRPALLGESEVIVEYSAVANPNDPVGKQPVASSVFKSNFWDLRGGEPLGASAYGPFYPAGVDLSAFLVSDLGLPVPDAEALPNLVPEQQAMPGINGPYVSNASQAFKAYYDNYPFFANFPFGYFLAGRNWFAAEGIPITTYDDAGRTNSYPLVRLQARARSSSLGVPAGTVLATVDVVAPVSGEADCKNCHTDYLTDQTDVGNGLATRRLARIATASEDDTALPLAVRQEHAADLNMLRLHDMKHGTTLEQQQPVACQTCHYTPALDLAQAGPSDDNGKSQTRHASMSRVMHDFHGRLCADGTATSDGNCTSFGGRLFPAMPGPVGRSAATASSVLEQTCYTCHPGKETKCLRGVMSRNAGSVCQDCHGDVRQVGDDFSGEAAPGRGFYTVSGKRIPWASEPACESCHTGDAVSNLASTSGVVSQPARNQSGASIAPIRLLQAWKTGDSTATPISASNRRFAEERTAGGQRVLYRLSTGHGGVFCEGCHGSTHAEWPAGVQNDASIGVNDNLAAAQIQGHEGKIQECDACHQRDPENPGSLTMSVGLNGPHGLHPVGDRRWNFEHHDYTSGNFSNCRTCHGQDLRGTPLSAASATRVLQRKDGGSVTFGKGHMFGCTDCHQLGN